MSRGSWEGKTGPPARFSDRAARCSGDGRGPWRGHSPSHATRILPRRTPGGHRALRRRRRDRDARHRDAAEPACGGGGCGDDHRRARASSARRLRRAPDRSAHADRGFHPHRCGGIAGRHPAQMARKGTGGGGRPGHGIAPPDRLRAKRGHHGSGERDVHPYPRRRTPPGSCVALRPDPGPVGEYPTGCSRIAHRRAP